MVIDTSALLALFFKEKHADWVASELNKHAQALRMSMVNLTETLIHLRDRQPQHFKKLEEYLLYNGIRFVAPDLFQAKLAAEARMKFPLNLGDCFAYALAIQENCPILTIDKDFRLLDCVIVYPY